MKIESAEGVELKKAKEAEHAKLEKQIRDQFPSVLQAFNTFRRACRVALFGESVLGRILSQNIRASQLHWGTGNDLFPAEYFGGSDTEFLFGAFTDLSLSSLTGDADIEYRVSNASGQVHEGVFKNEYGGLRSPDRFSQKLDEIQDLLDKGWSIETDALLTSLEFLYSDNYGMAVFNAATVLELVVVHFWEEKKKQLGAGSRQDQERLARLDREMDKSNYSTKVEKILRIALPQFIDSDLVSSGCLDRCIDAWNIRNKKLAHLYERVREGQQTRVTSSEAWNAVASIFALIDNVRNLQL